MIGDFFRFWWALVHLNLRKTLFRAKRGRGRCPCQSPSDSGRAWQTHCEEAAGWNSPARFRHVCPHLRRGPDGWRCTVDTADVRPFWGRALAFAGAAAVCAYVIGALAAFGVFRAQGYANLTPLDTLWPARWERIVLGRSEYFLGRAQQALLAHDRRAMWISLASASAAAKNHYEARLALAQIQSYLSAQDPATKSFQDLLADFPQHRARTAVAYHDVLVALQRFEALGDLAFRQLAAGDATEKSVWLRAAFIALRGSATPRELLARQSATLASLPPLWRNALAAEAAVRAGDLAALSRLQGLPLSAENVPLSIVACESLADLAPAADAIDEIVRAGSAIGDFERDRLLFRLHLRVGASASAARAFDAMLRSASRPGQRERLLATLVEFPDAARAGRLLSAASNPRVPFAPPELASLWIAAVAAENRELQSLAEQRFKGHYGIELGTGFPTAMNAESATLWLRTLAPGRETAWALALAFSPRRTETAPPARPLATR